MFYVIGPARGSVSRPTHPGEGSGVRGQGSGVRCWRVDDGFMTGRTGANYTPSDNSFSTRAVYPHTYVQGRTTYMYKVACA